MWNSGRMACLPFDPAKITTNYVAGEDGTENPDFERVMLNQSANIMIIVSFDIHHIT